MKINQYEGQLNPRNAAEGIKLAYENALTLLSDAELLFSHNRFERCVSLSILAIEEAGKSSIIRALLLTDDPVQLKKEWRNFRKHTQKNRAWILPDLIRTGARTLDDLTVIFDPKSGHGLMLDNLKQLSLYTDIFSGPKWSTPRNVIDKELAKLILSDAQSIIGIARVISTEKELELWTKHLKPVQGLGIAKMKQALNNCYLEAASKGLIENWMLPHLTNFLK